MQRKPRALLPHGLETRTWAFLPTALNAIEPLTPLSRPLFFPTPHPPSRTLPSGRTTRLLVLPCGSEDSENAKTTVDAFS
jgi:hypothetical protein